MNQKLQKLLDSIQQSGHLSVDEKDAFAKKINEVDKEIEIISFKLIRTEKVKRTTDILLEETIEELEQKRKAIEETYRELEIESSLERVRTVAMSMSKPDNLLNIAESVFKELQGLGFTELRNAIIQTFVDDKKYFKDYDFSDVTGGWISSIPYTGHPIIEKFVKNIRKNSNVFVETVISGKEMEEWMAFRKSNGEVNDPRLDGIQELFYYHYSIGEGDIGISTFCSINAEKQNLLKRFRNVFDLAYQRYTDIQKAEEQAREAQIETALERVRSRSLAMHKSDELNEVVSVLFERLKDLHIPFTAVGLAISIEGSKDLNAFVCGENEAGLVITNYRLPYFDNKISNDFNKVFENRLDYFVGHYSKEEKDAFYTYVLEHTPEFRQLPENIKRIIFDSASYTVSMMAVNKAIFNINDFEGKVLADDEVGIIKRFAKVFDQAYTRFLDLQKAETQAREAQIETALERVRSRTMAMHSSNELIATAELLYDQINQLGAESLGVAFGICNHDSGMVKKWTNIGIFSIPSTAESGEQKMYEAWRNQDEMYEEIYEGEKIKKYYETFMEFPAFREGFQKVLDKGYPLPTWQKNHAAIFKYGYLLFITTKPFEETNIFIRFAKVFEQTYTRFLDLQKAEAQTREAQIELGLERVRARAMAMQKSDELADAAQLLYREFGNLDINTFSCGYMFVDEAKQTQTAWVVLPDGSLLPNFIVFPLNGDQVLDSRYKDWKEKKPIHVFELQGEANKEHHRFLANYVPLFVVDDIFSKIPDRIIFNCANFSDGYLLILAAEHFSPAEQQTIIRFAKVFEMTYTRFNDLKQAEAQAREAKIEAALERVRSRTLAMQKSDELAETAAVLFKQLILLGIEPNRLYINIIKNDTAESEFWITDEDGSKVSSAFELNMNDNPSFKKMFTGWQEKKKSLVIDMSGKELKEYFQHLGNLHVLFKEGVVQKRRLQYMAYFNKGFIGMASPDEQPEETMNLLERFAAVFNLTFTRFNDLKMAEAHAIQAEEDLVKLHTEKRRAEDALSELQSTQKQLIHSEKMASLGELTAGIAHEIQNPLNFVNNFSEVSTELLDEMNVEIAKGNLEDAKQIAEDLKQNLQKINHHGKRAGDIVKGMLQHSRNTSNAIKEPTDINKLADEYLRLAYHGLRAKDKSFNATMKTDFDNTIGNINIIPQDIGRVILNLITNAFYAVDERKKMQPENLPTGESGYEPTVTVSTKKINDKTEIRVADNGNGIPQKILDKIFQPFFTTKPTGQGTGLGLSLSYDIVKAHGGELKVETIEGEGSEFIIQL